MPPAWANPYRQGVVKRYDWLSFGHVPILVGRRAQRLKPGTRQIGMLGQLLRVVLSTSFEHILALTRSIKTQVKTPRVSLLRVTFGSRGREAV